MSTSTNYKDNTRKVRALLTSYSDGLTRDEVMRLAGLPYHCAYKALARMFGVYVDRWTPNLETFKWVPVFCLASEPMADAPKPDISVKQYLERVE